MSDLRLTDSQADGLRYHAGERVERVWMIDTTGKEHRNAWHPHAGTNNALRRLGLISDPAPGSRRWQVTEAGRELLAKWERDVKNALAYLNQDEGA